MDLLLPPAAEAELINHEIAEQADEHMAEAVEWAKELKRIDSSLDLVWVGEAADDAELMSGRWHIRKRIPGTVDAYIPLVGRDGSYRPPGAWMLEWLTANDLWNPSVHRDKEEAKRKLGQARERARSSAPSSGRTTGRSRAGSQAHSRRPGDERAQRPEAAAFHCRRPPRGET